MSKGLTKNTGKAPSVQFYYKDFLADLQEHPPEIIGVWMLILIKIWHAKSNGKITRSITQWSLIMHVTEARAKEYLDYINKEDIGDVLYVTDDNSKITVVNRRAQRDAKLLVRNRLRQQAFRDKQGSNGDVAAQKGNPSTSTPISSSTPTPLIGIGKNSLEQEGLELEKKINTGALRFVQGLEQKFANLSKDERTTFCRIAQYLSDLVRRSQVGLEVFDKALGWAEDATTRGAQNPKGLFVAKVKDETGFRGRGLMLKDRRGVDDPD